MNIVRVGLVFYVVCVCIVSNIWIGDMLGTTGLLHRVALTVGLMLLQTVFFVVVFKVLIGRPFVVWIKG